MLKKYAIHEEGKPAIGYLYYNTETEQFKLVPEKGADKHDMPAFMYFMIEYGHEYVEGELALCFVRERLVPPERANIAQILADLGLPYYDEVLLLEAMRGRCVMDEFLIDLVTEPEGL